MTPENALRAEAVRVVPGVIAAQRRDDREGVVRLLRGYNETAMGFGITPRQAGDILWSGWVHWTNELIKRVATLEDSDEDTVVQMIAASAASWMSEEHGVGGY